jgi:hypothetical protein
MAHGHVRSHGFRRRRIDGRCNRATVRTLRIEPMRSCPRELHTRNVSSVKGTQDGSCITALDYEGDISIFAIENGSNCLVRPFSHQFPGRRYATSIFLVSEATQISLQKIGAGAGTPSRLSTERMEIECNRYTFLVKTHPFTGATILPRAIVSNGRELLCGFKINSRHRYMDPIEAYQA